MAIRPRLHKLKNCAKANCCGQSVSQQQYEVKFNMASQIRCSCVTSSEIIYCIATVTILTSTAHINAHEPVFRPDLCSILLLLIEDTVECI